jgi:hypothetical protein
MNKKTPGIFVGEKEAAEELQYKEPLSGRSKRHRLITYNPEKRPLEYRNRIGVNEYYQQEVWEFAAKSINMGKPLIAGVNLPTYVKIGKKGKVINEGITEHFVVIVGYEAEYKDIEGKEQMVVTKLLAVDNQTVPGELEEFLNMHGKKRAVSRGRLHGYSGVQISHIRPWPSQIKDLEKGGYSSYRNIFVRETRRNFNRKYNQYQSVTGLSIGIFLFRDDRPLIPFER